MKDVLKYLIIGIGIAIIEWIFLGLFESWFNGLDQTQALIIGASFFTVIVIIICTGLIISKIDNKKNK